MMNAVQMLVTILKKALPMPIKFHWSLWSANERTNERTNRKTTSRCSNGSSLEQTVFLSTVFFVSSLDIVRSNVFIDSGSKIFFSLSRSLQNADIVYSESQATNIWHVVQHPLSLFLCLLLFFSLDFVQFSRHNCKCQCTRLWIKQMDEFYRHCLHCRFLMVIEACAHACLYVCLCDCPVHHLAFLYSLF